MAPLFELDKTPQLRYYPAVFGNIFRRDGTDLQVGNMFNNKLVTTYQISIQTLRAGFKSTVARNAASLYLIQFANYIVPLIMVPYLVRVLGPAGYGAVAFAQGFINYLMLFVEYGFDWSATRKISVQRENLAAVNHTVLHVWAAKGLLALLGFVGLLALMALVPKLAEVKWLLLALYGLVLGNVLFPTWLFQGMERMVAISVINLGMKLSILAGVFLLVREPEDAIVYALLMGGGAIAAGLVGIVAAIRMFGLRLTSISWSGVWETLREGWVLFLSKASVSLYTAGNAFILGMLTNYTVVGYYSAAEKIVRAVVGVIGPVNQAIYPRIAALSQRPQEMLLFVRRLLPIMVGIGISVTLFLYAGSAFLVEFLLGADFERSILVIKILSFLGLNLSLATVWSTWLLIGTGRDKATFTILLVAGVINITLSIIIVPTLLEQGMALSVLASESFVNLAAFVYTARLKINPVVKGVSYGWFRIW